MCTVDLDRFNRGLAGSTFDDFLGHKLTIQKYVKERMAAHALGEESMYVNVAGGPREGAAIKKVWSWLQARGLTRYADVVPGPLLRATRVGDRHRLSHMPLNAKSTYTHLVSALDKAYEISQGMAEPDRELDLEGREAPHFGNHSGRRYADRKATDSSHLTGASKGQIDDHFGWQQRERKKDSQLHYHGRVEREKRARVTMMI